MKKNLQLFVLILSGILLFSCEYDDSFLRDEIENIKDGTSSLVFDNPNDEEYFLFELNEEKDLKIVFPNLSNIELVSQPEGWKVEVIESESVVRVLSTSSADFGFYNIKIQGIDANGLVYQAIAKVHIDGNIFGDSKGVFILNEGNMTTENGSLLFITSTGNVVENAFKSVNGTELGSVAQDLFIKDGKMYIIHQNSGLIVANTETLKEEYRTGLQLSWPSHIAVLNEKNIFIRDNNGVHIFNNETKEVKLVEGTRGASKKRMTVMGDKVYVIAGKKILVLEADKYTVSKEAEMNSGIGGMVKANDNNLWVSTTGTPKLISKVNIETLDVVNSNEISLGNPSAITAKGDTIYYRNSFTICRHIFSQNDSKEMINVKNVVENAGIVYGNVEVHPITGDVYMNTIKGFGWDFEVNNISLFEDKGDEMILKSNHTDFTRFPAGIFFNASFQ